LQQIEKFHNNVYSTVLLPKGGDNPLGVLTTDGRPCITSPTTGPRTAEPN